MIQLTNLGFGVPNFSFSLPIVWKVLYQSFTTAYNSLEFTFETLVAWFKPFKQLKHCFCLVDLPNFQTTYQNLVSTHMLSSKSHTKRWKVQKSQPFQPQWCWKLVSQPSRSNASGVWKVWTILPKFQMFIPNYCRYLWNFSTVLFEQSVD